MKKILRALLVIILQVRYCIKNKKQNNLHQHCYTSVNSHSFFDFSIIISLTIFHFEINITAKRLTKSLTCFSTRISYKKKTQNCNNLLWYHFSFVGKEISTSSRKLRI